MPQKPKKNKIRIKINDKKITDYMFDFTRTIICLLYTSDAADEL